MFHREPRWADRFSPGGDTWTSHLPTDDATCFENWLEAILASTDNVKQPRGASWELD